MQKEIHAGPIEARTKGEVKRLRRNGFVPVSVQQRGETTQHMQSRALPLDEIIRRHGESSVINLITEAKGGTKQVLVHDVQRHPVTKQLLHVTLQALVKGEKMKTHVPIRLVGEPEPVRQGTGVLQHATESLEVRADPTKLPDHVTVDISHLQIGDSIRVSDLPQSDYEVTAQPDTVIASVARVRLPEAEEPAAAEEEAATEQPEAEEQAAETA